MIGENRKVYWTKALIALALAFITFFAAVSIGNTWSKKSEKETISNVTTNERMQEMTKEIKTVMTTKPVTLSVKLDDVPETAFVKTSQTVLMTIPEPEAEEIPERIIEEPTIHKEPVTEEIIPITTAEVVDESPSQELNLYNYGYGVYWDDNDLRAMAITGTGEAEIVHSSMRRAAVYWTILNRVDYYGKSIISIITAPSQFDGYSANGNINDELLILARDVLSRWSMEKDGYENVGRVLPKDYMYFHGDGRENYFRNAYEAPYDTWDWSLPNPYES